MRVVEALNVVEDRGSRLTVRGERLAFEQFALEGGEERLGDGIVKAIPATAQGRYDALLLAATAEGDTRVLAAMVRVMDDARIGTAIPQRHV